MCVCCCVVVLVLAFCGFDCMCVVAFVVLCFDVVVVVCFGGARFFCVMCYFGVVLFRLCVCVSGRLVCVMFSFLFVGLCVLV